MTTLSRAFDSTYASELSSLGHALCEQSGVWQRPGAHSLAYSDGDDVENRLMDIVAGCSDVSLLSPELQAHRADWPTHYHLSGSRANVLRPLAELLQGDVLEIGSGCGAITRFLGESGVNVLALEGSLRRAAITRSRVRDLPNVTVVNDQFDLFRVQRSFDLVTLVGVLEYASVFSPGPDPVQSMLTRIVSLLKPGGHLVIAIENQLGLKYFAGANEDHLAQPMVGIENQYTVGQPKTFGRQDLDARLRRAGFGMTNFMACFPDYKFAQSIITERGCFHEGFDAAALAWQSVARDPQCPEVPTFSMARVWPSVFANRLGLDLANSFLVVASRNAQPPIDDRHLAWHVTAERLPSFCKKASFLVDADGSIRVLTEPLIRCAPPSRSQNSGVSFELPTSESYASGRLLSWDFLDIVTRDNWSMDDVGAFFRRYLDMLKVIVEREGQRGRWESADAEMAGRYLDCIPGNIVIDNENQPRFIDTEWRLESNVLLGHLVLRAADNLCNLARWFAEPASGVSWTRRRFITGVFESLELPINETMLRDFVSRESWFQESVSGLPDREPHLWLRLDAPLPRARLHTVLSAGCRERDLAGGQRDKPWRSFRRRIAKRLAVLFPTHLRDAFAATRRPKRRGPRQEN